MNSTAFDLLRKVSLLILTPQCFDNYFVDLNFFDGKCVSLLLNTRFNNCFFKRPLFFIYTQQMPRVRHHPRLPSGKITTNHQDLQK